jgi:hypothetical protein
MVDEIKVKMQVRGKALTPMPKFIAKKFGKQGLERWLDSIPVEAHQVFIFPIKPADWYPLKETLIDPTANIAQLFYNWDVKTAAWELGRFSADFGLKYLKLIVRMGSPRFLMNKASEIMASYYTPSRIEIQQMAESRAVFQITEFPELDKTVEYRMAGWIERALEINGCRNIGIDIPKSMTNFNPYTEFQVSWNNS